MDRWSDGVDRSAERWIANVVTNTIILRGLPASIEANDVRTHFFHRINLELSFFNKT